MKKNLSFLGLCAYCTKNNMVAYRDKRATKNNRLYNYYTVTDLAGNIVAHGRHQAEIRETLEIIRISKGE